MRPCTQWRKTSRGRLEAAADVSSDQVPFWARALVQNAVGIGVLQARAGVSIFIVNGSRAPTQARIGSNDSTCSKGFTGKSLNGKNVCDETDGAGMQGVRETQARDVERQRFHSPLRFSEKRLGPGSAFCR